MQQPLNHRHRRPHDDALDDAVDDDDDDTDDASATSLPTHPILLRHEAKRLLPPRVSSWAGVIAIIGLFEVLGSGRALLDGGFDGASFARSLFGGTMLAAGLRVEGGSASAILPLVATSLALAALAAATFPWTQAKPEEHLKQQLMHAAAALPVAVYLLWQRPQALRAEARRRRAQEALRQLRAASRATRDRKRSGEA